MGTIEGTGNGFGVGLEGAMDEANLVHMATTGKTLSATTLIFAMFSIFLPFPG